MAPMIGWEDQEEQEQFRVIKYIRMADVGIATATLAGEVLGAAAFSEEAISEPGGSADSLSSPEVSGDGLSKPGATGEDVV